MIPPQCSQLSDNANSILDLARQLKSNHQSIRVAEASLAKAVAPKFEIVFAGAFSAGKSMLINALLERELLYSADYNNKDYILFNIEKTTTTVLIYVVK